MRRPAPGSARLLVPALATALATGAARAHDAPGGASEVGAAPSGGAEPAADLTAAGAARGIEERQKVPVRWHGSTLSFDQSATTQTLGLGGDFQSADPTYEWWLAFRPRYYVYETNADAVSLNLWMNAYLELTNSDTTTRLHELLLGPTYLWASYAHAFRDRGGYKTSLTVGPRLTLPTDKAARDSGQIVGLGASAGASQTFPLRGKGRRTFRGARLGVTTTFNRPINRSTAPVNDGIRQLRQDVAGRTVVSDVLRGEMNARGTLNLSFYGDLQLVRRLALSASYVILSSWIYPPGPCPDCVDSMSPTTYKASTWLTTSLGYDLTDELSISLGYYNLASQIGRDGTRRSPLWSPSARLFLTLVGNLDAIYERLKPGGRAPGPATAVP